MPDGAVSRADRDAIAALRDAVEAGPLFTIPAARFGVTACRVTIDAGVLTVEYEFDDEGLLRVERDPRIEYTSQDGQFALPPDHDPVAVLMRAERAAFGDEGCGIDWEQAEIAPSDDAAAPGETRYRGDICNCQARIRRDAAGRVVGLLLRSAC